MAAETATVPEAEYAIATHAAGLADRSARGKIDVTGPDAAEFLQGQVTNDVEALQPGAGCYVAILDPKAHLISDARVLRMSEDRFRLDTEPVALEATLKDLRTYKIGRSVEIVDRTEDGALLSLIGPRSAEVAEVALGCRSPQGEHQFTEASIDGQATLVIATAFGVDVMTAVATAGAARIRLLGAGAKEISEHAVELMRIEQGLPRYGVDMTFDNLPGEAGIVQRAVSFTKGCYVGQEPVARMFHKGHPNRHLRGVLLSEPISAGSALFANGREVGRATSTAVSPRLGPIALSILRREVAPSDELTVEGIPAKAKAIELPFEQPDAWFG